MKALLSVLCVIFLVGVATATLSVTETTCVVTGNDYPGAGCSCDNPTTSDDTGARKRRPVVNPFSCLCDGDTGYGTARINISLGGSNPSVTVCNTLSCGLTDILADVQSFLGTYSNGARFSTCYQDNNNAAVLFVDSAAICSYRGTYSTATGTCTCSSSSYYGDYCENTVQPTPRPAAGSAILPTLALLLAAVLFLLF